MNSNPVSLAGIQTQAATVSALPKNPIPLAPGSEWPEGLKPEQLWLLPGVFDLSCRLGEPGPPHPASLGSELRAARRNGFDTVLMNPDSEPCVDNAAVIEWIEHRAAAANGAQLRLLGALTQHLEGTSLTSMDSLRRSGVAGLSQGLRDLPDAEVLLSALRYAQGVNLRVHLLARLPPLHQGIAAEGARAAAQGLHGIPVAAETAALGLILALVEETGCAVHIGRISSASGVSWLRWAKTRGLPVTADVSLPQLLANEEILDEFNPLARLDPPLRTANDQTSLIEGLADGTIDAICSDHNPHPRDQYQQPLASIPPGAIAFDGFLPLLLNHPALAAVPLSRKLDAISREPAAIMGCSDAPMGVIFDPRADSGTLNGEQLHSASCNTPLLGQKLQGRVLGAIIKGELHMFAPPSLTD